MCKISGLCEVWLTAKQVLYKKYSWSINAAGFQNTTVSKVKRCVVIRWKMLFYLVFFFFCNYISSSLIVKLSFLNLQNYTIYSSTCCWHYWTSCLDMTDKSWGFRTYDTLWNKPPPGNQEEVYLGWLSSDLRIGSSIPDPCSQHLKMSWARYWTLNFP